jgi:hypothetical protein
VAKATSAAPAAMTSDPASTAPSGASAVRSSPKTSTPQASPHSWLVFDSGIRG